MSETNETIETDVLVIGASVAGCAAATLFAREGLRVLLVDRVQDAAAYKKQCTHLIQGSAVPVLERLGVVEELERAGARRGSLQIWTRAGGWARLGLDQARDAQGRRNHGYNIRREKLDPILRATAARTPGVTLRLGHRIEALRTDAATGRCVGATLAGPEGAAVTVAARLVVGADGRRTRVGELAKLEPELRPHNRGGFMAYFANVPTRAGDDAQFWVLGEDVAYAFPTDDGLVCLAVVVNERKLAEFKADREGYVRRFYAALPDGPDLSRAERVGDFVGVANTPNTYRWPAHPGLALVGDAAMASDYIWGVGCGFALQGAGFLVDHAARALRESPADPRPLDAALAAYARQHKEVLYSQHVENSAFSASSELPGLLRSVLEVVPQDRALQRLIALAGLGRASRRDLRVPLRLALFYLTRPFRRASLRPGAAAPFFWSSSPPPSAPDASPPPSHLAASPTELPSRAARAGATATTSPRAGASA